MREGQGRGGTGVREGGAGTGVRTFSDDQFYFPVQFSFLHSLLGAVGAQTAGCCLKASVHKHNI